jgi:hypothetical protein
LRSALLSHSTHKLGNDKERLDAIAQVIGLGSLAGRVGFVFRAGEGVGTVNLGVQISLRLAGG